MAKVTATKGRDTKAPRTFLFCLADFMLQRCHFGLHFPHGHVASFAARLVKEVNNTAGHAAEKYYQESHRADELRNRDRGMTNVVQHDLQDLFAQTEPGETNWQSGDGAFDRQDGEEIEHFHAFRKCRGHVEGVGYAKERGEGCKVRSQRRAERDEGGDPVPGIKMVSRRNLNQFFAAGKFVRQPVKKIEATNDETGEQGSDRAAQKKQQYPKQSSRLWSL